MKYNRYSKQMVIALAIMLAPSVQDVSAQKVRNLSLDEAVNLSLQNSGQLKLANARVDEALAQYHEAKNNRLPDLKASGSYIRLNHPNVELKVKLGNGSSAGNPVSVDQAAYGSVNASLPIFSGGRIKYGIESAKYLEQAAKLDAGKDKDEVIQTTIDAYGNLYKAANSVALVNENLKNQIQRVNDFTNLEKNGLMARNDLLKAQLQKSNIEVTLLDAEDNLKIANINMNLMLGLPEDTQLMPDSAIFVKPADAGSVIQWEQTAFENRKDLEALGMRENAASSAIKSAKGEYYPSLAVTGGLLAADVPNVLILTGALNGGLGLSYNVSSLWKAGAKVDAAKARLHQVQATKGMLNDRIKVEINHAYQNYLLSVKKIGVYAEAIEQANENYRITKNKYKNSLVTTTDLLDADVAQLQSQINYSSSKVDAMVAYKKLQQTAGVISK